MNYRFSLIETKFLTQTDKNSTEHGESLPGQEKHCLESREIQWSTLTLQASRTVKLLPPERNKGACCTLK